MAAKTHKTSNSTEGEVAEALYNKGEGQSAVTDIEEMSIDEVRILLENTDWSTVKGGAERSLENPVLDLNLLLPEKDFNLLLKRLHALERAFT